MFQSTANQKTFQEYGPTPFPKNTRSGFRFNRNTRAAVEWQLSGSCASVERTCRAGAAVRDAVVRVLDAGRVERDAAVNLTITPIKYRFTA